MRNITIFVECYCSTIQVQFLKSVFSNDDLMHFQVDFNEKTAFDTFGFLSTTLVTVVTQQSDCTFYHTFSGTHAMDNYHMDTRDIDLQIEMVSLSLAEASIDHRHLSRVLGGLIAGCITIYGRQVPVQ